MISVLPVRRVQRKASSSGWRLTALSQSTEGFGGHDISVLFERIASSRTYSCISSALDGVSLLSALQISLHCKKTTAFPMITDLENFSFLGILGQINQWPLISNCSRLQ